jgi:hypothetical protein
MESGYIELLKFQVLTKEAWGGIIVTPSPAIGVKIISPFALACFFLRPRDSALMGARKHRACVESSSR